MIRTYFFFCADHRAVFSGPRNGSYSNSYSYSDPSDTCFTVYFRAV